MSEWETWHLVGALGSLLQARLLCPGSASGPCSYRLSQRTQVVACRPTQHNTTSAATYDHYYRCNMADRLTWRHCGVAAASPPCCPPAAWATLPSAPCPAELATAAGRCYAARVRSPSAPSLLRQLETTRRRRRRRDGLQTGSVRRRGGTLAPARQVLGPRSGTAAAAGPLTGLTGRSAASGSGWSWTPRRTAGRRTPKPDPRRLRVRPTRAAQASCTR